MRSTLTAALTLLMVLALGGPAAARVGGPPGDATIAEIATDDGRFGTLLFALDAAGLTGAVTGDDSVTVLAPTDAAFQEAADELAGGDLDALVGVLVDAELLDDVLLYHVVDGRRFSNSLVNRNNDKPVTTLLGEELTTTPDATILDASGDETAIVLTDLNASNGVVHVVDDVLIPQVVVDALSG